MDKSTILQFIDKTISKTKDKELKWRSLKGKEGLLKKASIDAELSSNKYLPNVMAPFTAETINYELSFYSKFYTGYIFLICWNAPGIAFDSKKSLCLCIQNDTSPFRKDIVSTSEDIETTSQLKRLCNIIIEYTNDLDSFIDDFLNS